MREIEEYVRDVSGSQTRKERRSLYDEMNRALIDMAFQKDYPDLLGQVIEPTKQEIFDLIRRTAGVYRDTRAEKWFSVIFTLVNKLDRKSHQSEILAEVSKDLIQAGVDAGDFHFIEKGGEAFNQISIRKYRSAILIEIIPLLITYGKSARDVSLMYRGLEMLGEIGDISKQSRLHAEVAKAIATIGIDSGNIEIVVGALRSATEINQKIRRMNCLSTIIDATWKSPLKKEIADVEHILRMLADVPEERIVELLSIMTEQLLDRMRDRKQVYGKLLKLDEEMPAAGQTLVLELLKKAERSGERWYLEKAFEFNARRRVEGQLPIEEIVLSGIAVVEKTGNPAILLDITPLIESSCDAAKATHLYRQITDALSRMGDFYHAIEVMKKASARAQRINAQFFETSVRLIKEGINRDEPELIKESILSALDIDIADSLVQQAVTEFCREYSFEDVIRHIPSIRDIVRSHHAADHLLLECNTILIDRGFVRSADPSALVNLVGQIRQVSLREQAISSIVVEMARIGVAQKNRDLLRRATGLTCEIENPQARAEAMGGIIDHASVLAVEDGDLDLLHGMRVLSSSLLEREYCLFALGKVIHGLIMYGIEQLSLQALEEATQILEQVTDPSLQRQLIDPLIEGYVRVGSLLIAAESARERNRVFDHMLDPFEQALELLKANAAPEEISIKIASYVDILLEYMQVYPSPMFSIPMAMFSLEIRGEYERNAMVQRILTYFEDFTREFDSADPYEVMAYLLESVDQATSSPVVLELMYRLFDLTGNVFAQFTGIYRIVDAYRTLGNIERGQEIASNIHEAIVTIPLPHVRAVMLADLAGLMAGINDEDARRFLSESLATLDLVEPDREAFVRKQLIYSIKNIHATNRRDEDIDWAVQQVAKITDPVEYLDALGAIFDMVEDAGQRKDILSTMCQTVVGIPSPYIRLSMLFDVARFADAYGDEENVNSLLEGIGQTAELVQIPFVAAMAQQQMARMLFSLYRKTGKPAIQQRAIDTVSMIKDDRIRYNLMIQLEQPTPPVWKNTVYGKIMESRDKIRVGEYTTKDMVSLDRAIRSVPDRAKRSIYYTELYLFSRNAGQDELADRMLLCALEEARIIRPLSRRAFVLGDMACRICAERHEDKCREIINMAVNEALNIRDSELRDEVYDELDMSIQITQEHWL
ncbi:MAG: hypothetical protein PHV57_02700 [Methanomicrobiaceae archaeon]|nr:hypothetical protein [Methanomicrobiaceae archaeon]